MAKHLLKQCALLLTAVHVSSKRVDLVKAAEASRLDFATREASRLESQMEQCVVHGRYGANGDPSFPLVRKVGFPKGKCVLNCMRLPYQRVNGFLKLEKDFMNEFMEDADMWKDGLCTCRRAKDQKQMLPSYFSKGMCTKRDCWNFYKKIFQIEAGVNAWRADSSCEPCFPGDPDRPCDEVIFDKALDDEAVATMKAQAEQSGGKGGVSDLWNRVQKTFGGKNLAVNAKVAQETYHWVHPENPRCSEPCDDGSEDFKSIIVDPYVCVSEKNPHVVDDKHCVDVAKPSEEVACAVPLCRAAWMTAMTDGSPMWSKAVVGDGEYSHSGWLDGSGGKLPLDGLWMRKDDADAKPIVFKGTTPSSSYLVLQIDESDRTLSTDQVIDVQIDGSELRYFDAFGNEMVGSYTDKSTDDAFPITIFWNATHGDEAETWVRFQSTGTGSAWPFDVPLIDGAWVNEQDGQYRGVFTDTTANSTTFQFWDGHAVSRQSVAIVDGKIAPSSGVLIQSGGTFSNGQLLNQTLRWEDSELGGETWIRLLQPRVSAAAWSKCSLECVDSLSEENLEKIAQSTQTRKLKCVVETPPFSGNQEVRDSAACEKLIGDAPMPTTVRPCLPRPQLCKDWKVAVVCKDLITGETLPDEECAHVRPKPSEPDLDSD